VVQGITDSFTLAIFVVALFAATFLGGVYHRET